MMCHVENRNFIATDSRSIMIDKKTSKCDNTRIYHYDISSNVTDREADGSQM